MTENVPISHNQSYSLEMPNPQEFQMLQIIAKNAQDSGLYSGVGQQAKILMILLSARELGVSPMLALNGGIWNIQGKIEVSARLMNGLIRRAGHSIKIICSNDEICTLRGTRSDGDSFECTFSMADAAKAGLNGGNVWKKYPADMLYNRCMSRLARRLFPDVIGTAYVEGEIKEAKEIEDKERNLAIAECEVKGPVLQIDSNLEQQKHDINLDQDTKISADQLRQVVEGMLLVDEKFKENYDKYKFEKWNVIELQDLPSRAFEPTMIAIKRNIEMNKKGSVENA